MSNQEQIMSQLNDLQASAKSLFEMIDLEKGKLPFEISPECTQHYNLWWNADDLAKFLGDGWRLPTCKEAEMLGEFVDVGVRVYGQVWTSETIDEDVYDDFDIWAVDLQTGEKEQCEAYTNLGVVFVRDRSNN
jgi:hypothetical protein